MAIPFWCSIIDVLYPHFSYRLDTSRTRTAHSQRTIPQFSIYIYRDSGKIYIKIADFSECCNFRMSQRREITITHIFITRKITDVLEGVGFVGVASARNDATTIDNNTANACSSTIGGFEALFARQFEKMRVQGYLSFRCSCSIE